MPEIYSIQSEKGLMTDKKGDNEFIKNLGKMNKLTNNQLMILLKDSIQTIEGQDEEIIQLTGERDAYKEGVDQLIIDNKILNEALDKYEPRVIDKKEMEKMDTFYNSRSRIRELRAKKVEDVKQKTKELINKKLEYSRRHQ